MRLIQYRTFLASNRLPFDDISHIQHPVKPSKSSAQQYPVDLRIPCVYQSTTTSCPRRLQPITRPTPPGSSPPWRPERKCYSRYATRAETRDTANNSGHNPRRLWRRQDLSHEPIRTSHLPGSPIPLFIHPSPALHNLARLFLDRTFLHRRVILILLRTGQQEVQHIIQSNDRRRLPDPRPLPPELSSSHPPNLGHSRSRTLPIPWRGLLPWGRLLRARLRYHLPSIIRELGELEG
jgi:hypothetical protein